MERELFSMFQDIPQNKTLYDSLFQRIKNMFTPIASRVKKEMMLSPQKSLLLEKLKAAISTSGYNDLSLIETMKKEDFEKLLSSIETSDFDDTSKSKFTDIKNDINNWFDITIKSFQEHYERRMKLWSYLLSAIVVIWLNANLFSVYQEFSGSKVFRENAVTFGENFQYPIDDISQDSTFTLIRKNVEDINTYINMNSFQIIRWNISTGSPLRLKTDQEWTLKQGLTDFKNAIWNNFFGWIAMIFLVGLGAPFWYDFLKTVMGLKNKFKNQENN